MIIYLDKTTYQEFDAWLCNKAKKYNFRVSYDQTGYIDDLGDLDRVPKKIYPLRIFLRKIYPNGSVDGKNDGFFIMEKVGERLKVCPKAYEKGVESLKPILKEIADDWPETREIIMRDVFKNNQEIVDKETKGIRQEPTLQIQSIGSESPVKGIFRRDGECWHIEYGKENKDIKDSKGMHYIHVLLSNPNKDIISTELYRLGNKLFPEGKINLGDDDNYLSITEDDDIYPVLDPKYKKELLDAKEKFELELTALHDAGGDSSDIREKEDSLDIINKELSNSTRNGKSKNLNKSPLDKARQTISASIDRSYKNMRSKPDEMIGLVRYLQGTIKRGKVFIYKDDKPVKWEL